MITDSETNLVYISELLKIKCPEVFKQLIYWFEKLDIKYDLLHDTKDIWAVDFMPIQIGRQNFIQFVYDPDYLKPRIHRSLRTNPDEITGSLQIAVQNSDIVLDGGNIVRSKGKVIATDKIFKENPGYKGDDLIDSLKQLLLIDQFIIIPTEPGDFIGHADGMVRFIDDTTVVINDYPGNKTYSSFNLNLRNSLHNAGLKCITLPYTAWKNRQAIDATGCYINFLEVGNYIFCPQFSADEDQLAMQLLKQLFINRTIIGIHCCELAQLGGVLNCATWNVLC